MNISRAIFILSGALSILSIVSAEIKATGYISDYRLLSTELTSSGTEGVLKCGEVNPKIPLNYQEFDCLLCCQQESREAYELTNDVCTCLINSQQTHELAFAYFDGTPEMEDEDSSLKY